MNKGRQYAEGTWGRCVVDQPNIDGSLNPLPVPYAEL